MSGLLEKRAAENAEEASHMMRAMVTAAPSYLMVPLPMLSWYLRRRQLDLLLMDENKHVGLKGTREPMLEAIMDDIRMIEQALETHEAAHETAH